jgi:hypothetical protein
MELEESGTGCSSSATSKAVILDALYYQCRASRTSSHREALVSISTDGTFGKKVIAPAPIIGSLEDHAGITETFHGSRITRAGVTVNQSISMSFDPSNLSCITCKTEHEIIGKLPTVLCFSDQNFVPSLHDNKGGGVAGCLNIVRVENPTLMELFELAKETFASTRFPEGSVMLFGSASYLGSCGTTIYAREWTAVAALASAHWCGVHICPLIPLILSPCPGSVTRELCEFSIWLGSIYDNDTKGMREVWGGLAEAMETASTGSISLDLMDSYKVALPESLANNNIDKCITFCTTNSRPVTCNGLPKDTCDELLSNLLTNIYSNFRACASPESYLPRAHSAEEKKTFLRTKGKRWCLLVPVI